LRTQPDINLFERSEESDKGAVQMGGRAPGTPEIAVPELVGGRDHRTAQGTVFMGAPRPGQTILGVNPNRKPHVILWTAFMTNLRLAIVAVMLASFAGGHAAAQSLDFATYRSKVEPIFLKKREGHARCVVCHAGSGNAFRLQPLAPGATTWTEEQSRQNFEFVSRLVIKANLMSSPILKHPLAGEAGGDDFHSGGRQFLSQSDPDWKTIADWARGSK
jgi:hypothetical protein